ncbi:hypothetical protein l11_11780 [Neisseria weaveri LMG 5135]|nr:hypothetical protein l13_18690 [Neisseria weaveri ATCC 51223]EGV37425.1 hypothetical protein l11_11780 [Neisseria weaveri LMG 5135]
MVFCTNQKEKLATNIEQMITAQNVAKMRWNSFIYAVPEISF